MPIGRCIFGNVDALRVRPKCAERQHIILTVHFHEKAAEETVPCPVLPEHRSIRSGVFDHQAVQDKKSPGETADDGIALVVDHDTLRFVDTNNPLYGIVLHPLLDTAGHSVRSGSMPSIE